MFDTDTLAPGLLPGVAWSQFEPSGLLTDLLASLDVGRLDADDALEIAAAWERLVTHAQAQQFRALARFASLRQAPDLDEFAADEVAPVLHLSRGTAGARLDFATPAVHAAARHAGRIAGRGDRPAKGTRDQ
jgi:hypothetical protein